MLQVSPRQSSPTPLRLPHDPGPKPTSQVLTLIPVLALQLVPIPSASCSSAWTSGRAEPGSDTCRPARSPLHLRAPLVFEHRAAGGGAGRGGEAASGPRLPGDVPGIPIRLPAAHPKLGEQLLSRPLVPFNSSKHTNSNPPTQEHLLLVTLLLK